MIIGRREFHRRENGLKATLALLEKEREKNERT